MSKKAKIAIIIVSAVVGVMLLTFFGILLVVGAVFGIGFFAKDTADAEPVETTKVLYEDNEDNDYDYDPDYTFEMPDSLTVPEVTQPTVTYLEPTSADYELLKSMVFTTAADFNRNYQDATEVAYISVIGLFGNYHAFFDDSEFIMDTADPLNQFYDTNFNSYQYDRFKAENVDWILKNVYGITPDHHLSIDFDWTDTPQKYMYYYDGYYYVISFATGMEEYAGNIEATPEGNGIYNIKIDVCDMDGTIGYKQVRAGVRMVDGRRIWEIYTCYNVDNSYGY